MMSQGAYSIEQVRIRSAISASLHILIWVYVIVAVVCSFATPMTKFDDAIPLLHATLIQRGYTPNLDFYSFYPPLGLYWNAALLQVLGQTIVAARVAAGLPVVAVLFLVTRFFRSRFGSDPLVTGAILLFAVTAGTAITMPVWTGFAFSLTAFLVYLCSREESLVRYRISLSALSGALAAVAVLSRINFGAYVVFVIGLDFLRRPLQEGTVGLRSRLKSEAVRLIAFAVPLIFSCVGLSLLIYGRKVDIALWEFTVSAQRFMVLRGFLDLQLDTALGCALTFPFFWFWIRLLKGADGFVVKDMIPAVFGAGVLALALAGGRHYWIAPVVVLVEVALVLIMHFFIFRLDDAELAILLFYSCMLHYYISRADSAHMRLLPIVGMLLMPFLLLSPVNPEKKPAQRATSRGTALAVVVAMIFIVITIPELGPGFSAFRTGLIMLSSVIRDSNMSDSDRMLGDVPPAWGWHIVYDDEEELAALRYFRERTSAQTPLFVGSTDHSRIRWNDLRMYWLAGRPIAVRTFQLETRVATEEPVQREIISDLEKRKNTWIILDTYLEGDRAYIQANYQGSMLLDGYIAQHFQRVAEFGRYRVFTRASD
jgi:hypothetical protein